MCSHNNISADGYKLFWITWRDNKNVLNARTLTAFYYYYFAIPPKLVSRKKLKERRSVNMLMK